MKWLNTLIGTYHGWIDSKKIAGQKSEASNGRLPKVKQHSQRVKDWALSVLESSETVEQSFTGLKLLELAGLTDCDEYKVWNEFKNSLEWQPKQQR
jgi:hypothetical protein